MEEMEMNGMEGKKIIQNYFYGHIRNVVNGDFYNYGVEAEKNDHVEKEQQMITRAQLRQMVPDVQDMFWGNSSHAVIFCCIRDFYNYPNNMSQYERDMADPDNALRLNYQCTGGTLAMAFANNPFLKLHVDRWKEYGVKNRVLRLVEQFRSRVDAQNHENQALGI